jgi:hypothetical protein
MTSEDYVQMPTERLLRLFAETANESGVGRVFQYGGGPPPEAVLPTREQTQRGFARNAAIAGALSGKATAPEIEPLFDSDDPDIRICAAALLSEFAPALSEAAWRGVMAKCSTREALAHGARARTPPPARPTLAEMDDDALMARFEDAAERLTACRFIDWRDDEKDADVRNAIIVEQSEIGAEIRRRGMLARLLPFLDDAEPSVRLFAALGCLRIAAAKAAATLEEIGANGYIDDRAVALDNLQRWRNGSRAVAPSDGAGGWRAGAPCATKAQADGSRSRPARRSLRCTNRRSTARTTSPPCTT